MKILRIGGYESSLLFLFKIKGIHMSLEITYRTQSFVASIILFALIVGFNIIGLPFVSLVICMAYWGLDHNLSKDVCWLEIKENYWSKIGSIFGIITLIAFVFHGGSIIGGITFAVAAVFLIGFSLLIVWEYLPLRFTHPNL